MRLSDRCGLVLLALLGSWQTQAAELKPADPYTGQKKVLIIGDLHTGAR